MRFKQNPFWLAPAFALLLAPGVRADVFELNTGGHVHGALQNADQNPRTTYVVALESGAIVTLEADQVRQVIRRSPLEDEYDRRRFAAPDTAEAHWELARWCGDNRLRAERKKHLKHVIQLDPDHAEARRILGYRKIDGEWRTQDEEMLSRGFVKYEGRWLTPQDAEIRERNKAIELAEIEWRKNIRRWRGWLDKSDAKKQAEASENILGATDPNAAAALLDLLEKEDVHAVKLLLLAALSNNPHGGAIDAIANHALFDASPEVRQRCVEYLVAKNDPYLVRRFVQSLKSEDNVELNRAAYILGALGYPDAISPLIDVLITKHKFANPNAGRTSASFQKGGGGGFGSGGPKYIVREARNTDVLNALIKLSQGPSFDYNEQAWRRWYTSSQREAVADMRRD